MSDAAHPESTDRDFQRIRNRLNSGDSPSPPNIVVIHPTDRCNHQCDWCWYDRSRSEIHPDFVDRVVNNVIVEPTMVEEVIIAGGGEPLLYSKFENLIVSIGANSPDALLKVDTNGSLLRRVDPNIVRQIDYLRFSLDATNPQEYARTRHVKPEEWNRVLQNIEWARRIAPDIQLGVSLVEHRNRGERELQNLVRLLTNMGVNWVFRKPVLSRDFQLSPLDDTDSPEEASVLTRTAASALENLTETPDSVASMLVMVGADMGVYTCYHMQGDSDAQLALLTDDIASRTDSICRREEVWRAQSRKTHPCRAHAAWQSFTSPQGT